MPSHRLVASAWTSVLPLIVWTLSACGSSERAGTGEDQDGGTADGSVPRPPDADVPDGYGWMYLVVEGGGTGQVTGSGLDCTTNVCIVFAPAGTTVTLTATPHASSTLGGWSVPACGASPTCDFVVPPGQTEFSVTFLDRPGPVAPFVLAEAGFDSLRLAATTDGVILSGNFASGATLGDRTLTGGSGATHHFVARLTSAGEVLWVRTLLGPGGHAMARPAVLPGGDVIVFSEFDHEVDGLPQVTGEANDAFVARLDGTDGSIEWARPCGTGEGIVNAADLVVDAQGGAVVAGRVIGNARMDFGGIALDLRGRSAFLARVDVATGDVVWARSVSDADYVDHIDRLVALPGGDIFALGGGFTDGFTGKSFRARYDVATGEERYLVISPSGSGQMVWGGAVVTGTGDAAQVLAVGHSTSTNVGGDFLYAESGYGQQLVVVAYASDDGAHLASYRAGGLGDYVPVGLDPVPGGERYAVALRTSLDDSFPVDAYASLRTAQGFVSSFGDSEQIVLELDARGAVLDSFHVGAAGAEQPTDIVHAAGRRWLVGNHGDGADVGGGRLVGDGAYVTAWPLP